MPKSFLHFTNQLCLRHSHTNRYPHTHSDANPSANAGKLQQQLYHEC